MSSSARPTAMSSRWARRTRTRPSGRDAQPVGAGSHPGRLERWFRRGRGGRYGAGRARVRHRRIDPPAGGALRRGWAEADLRSRVALRPDRLRVVARPDWPADAQPSATRAIALQVLAGTRRPADATSAAEPVPDYAAALELASVRDVRVGVPQAPARKGVERRASPAQLRAALEALAARGALLVVDVELPHRAIRHPRRITWSRPPRRAPTWRATTASVIGFRAPAAAIGHATRPGTCIAKRAHRGSAPRSKRRIMLGTYVLSAGYYDAYYLEGGTGPCVDSTRLSPGIRGRGRRRRADQPDRRRSRWASAASDPLQMYLGGRVHGQRQSWPDFPAISVPCGFTANRLPIGLQLTRRRLRRSDAAARRRRLRARYAMVEDGCRQIREPPSLILSGPHWTRRAAAGACACATSA